jgi:hypothetical protein
MEVDGLSWDLGLAGTLSGDSRFAGSKTMPIGAPNVPQSEHPATSNTPGQRPNHPSARAARQGPPRRLSYRPTVTTTMPARQAHGRAR